MTREKLAAAIVITVMAAALIALRGARVSSKPKTEQTPQDVIYLMFDSAKAGDAKDYLACFEDGLRAELESAQSKMGSDKFSSYLLESQRHIKGIAISPRGDPFSDPGDEADFDVELIFADRNEVQVFTMTRDARRWLIASMSDSQYREPAVPYNSPAVPLGPPPGLEQAPGADAGRESEDVNAN